MAKVRNFETDRDIENLLEQDIREKKRANHDYKARAGRGAKNRMKGGMRTQADMLKGKEKREYTKPGELIVFNLKEIINKEEFFKKSEDDQKRLLETWRGLYRNDEIFEKSDIPKTTYYELVAKFGLKHARGGNMGINKRDYAPEQIEEFKKSILDFDTFLTLQGEQKAEVMEHYDATYTIKELMAAWNCKDSIVYAHRSGVKKWREKQAAAAIKSKQKSVAIQAARMPEIEPEPIQEALTLSEPEIAVSEPIPFDKSLSLMDAVKAFGESMSGLGENMLKTEEKQPKKIKTFRIVKPETKKEPLPIPQPEATGTDYRVSGIFTSDELCERLDKINLLVSGELSKFEINFTIKELPLHSEDKQAIENKEKMEKLMETLKELVPSIF